MFDKEEYWIRRNNTIAVRDADGKPMLDLHGNEIKERKPLRGQYYPSTQGLSKPSSVEIGFGPNGTLIIKNRKFRRQRIKLPTNMQKKSKRNK